MIVLFLHGEISERDLFTRMCNYKITYLKTPGEISVISHDIYAFQSTTVSNYARCDVRRTENLENIFRGVDRRWEYVVKSLSRPVNFYAIARWNCRKKIPKNQTVSNLCEVGIT